MPQKGDLIISNDLMGFVVDAGGGIILLNTTVGQKEIQYSDKIAVLATPNELAKRCASKLIKKVKK